MKFWKKMALGSTAVLAAMSLAACSNGSSNSSSSSSSSNKSANLTLWVDTEQVPYYKQIAKEFTKKNKNIKVRVVQSPNGSANAKTDVGKDPSKAADVFEVPNDQLGQMAEAGYINPLSPSATKDIKANYISVASKGVTWKNKIYAFPYAQQAQTIYYNKSKLSADDVKDWKTLTSKGVVATDFTNAYVMWPVMFSAGTKLYGDKSELAAYITNKKAQLIAHKEAGQIPVLKAAVNSSAVKSDPVAEAVIEMAKPGNSVLQPMLPQMATFWNESAPLISGTYDGKIKPAQYKAKLAKLQKDISKK